MGLYLPFECKRCGVVEGAVPGASVDQPQTATEGSLAPYRVGLLEDVFVRHIWLGGMHFTTTSPAAFNPPMMAMNPNAKDGASHKAEQDTKTTGAVSAAAVGSNGVPAVVETVKSEGSGEAVNISSSQVGMKVMNIATAAAADTNEPTGTEKAKSQV